MLNIRKEDKEEMTNNEKNIKEFKADFINVIQQINSEDKKDKAEDIIFKAFKGMKVDTYLSMIKDLNELVSND